MPHDSLDSLVNRVRWTSGEESGECTLQEWMEENSYDLEEQFEFIRALAAEGRVHVGGGAAPLVIVELVSP